MQEYKAVDLVISQYKREFEELKKDLLNSLNPDEMVHDYSISEQKKLLKKMQKVSEAIQALSSVHWYASGSDNG